MSEDLRLLEFKYEDNDLSLYINKPTAADLEEADVQKALAYQKGIARGLPLKSELENTLKKRGISHEELEIEVKKLQKELGTKLDKLDEGGIKLEDAKKLALEINDLRNSIILKLADKRDFMVSTAEGKAEQSYLDYLVSVTTVYNDDRKKKYFKDYQDYLNRKSDHDAFVITQRYAEIMYDTVFDEKRLPENEFLIEYGFMNNDMRLVNKEGHLVDTDGNLVNNEGQKIEIVDGKEVVIGEKKRKPFLDENGDPIDK